MFTTKVWKYLLKNVLSFFISKHRKKSFVISLIIKKLLSKKDRKSLLVFNYAGQKHSKPYFTFSVET